jgi:hypothetical protein
MRGDERFQSFRANERGVAGQHQREFRASERAPGDLHGVACAVLRLLQDRRGPERLDHASHLFRLMPHDDDGFAGFERFTRSHDLFHKSAPTGAVQYFGEAGFEASAFSRSEDNNREVVVGHG